MTARKEINSWKWRIVRAGHNARSFAELVGVPASQLSEYCSGNRNPSIERFDLIESKLKQLDESVRATKEEE